MIPKRAQTLLIGCMAVFILSGCELSLAQDITPPPNYQRVSLERPSADDVFVLPADSPDITSGRAIFAESCAPCHGETGTGGGSQAANLPTAPPLIGSAELASQSSPVDWFGIITLGNIEALMPPFEESLSVQQRWDVLAYIYSLSGSEQALTAVLPEDMQIVETVDAINEAETTELPEEAEDPDFELGTITGLVTHGGDEEIPSDLEVNLLGLDDFNPVVNKTTKVKSDGSFLFEQVALVSDRIFFVSMDYQGMNYGSRFDIFLDGKTNLDLPLTIYETTQDSSNLVISALILQIEFPTADTTRLHYIYQVSNPTLETVIPSDADEPVLRYKLPPNAVNFALEGQLREDNFVFTSDGFGDMRSIMAGSETYTIAFGYELPYSRDISLVIELGWPVEKLVVLLPTGALQLKNDLILKVDETQLGNEQYQVFSGDSFQPGTLQLQITGRNPSAQPGFLGLDIDVELVVSISVFAVALATAFLWINRIRAGSRVPISETSEDMMDSIIALDDRYETGNLAKDVYIQRRQAIKSRLREFVHKSK